MQKDSSLQKMSSLKQNSTGRPRRVDEFTLKRRIQSVCCLSYYGMRSSAFSFNLQHPSNLY